MQLLGQLRPADAVAGEMEEGEQLGVTSAERHLLLAAAQQRGAATGEQQVDGGTGAGRGGGPLPAKLLLDGAGGRREQWQHERGDGIRAAGHVEDPDGAAGAGIEHGHGAAAPGVHRLLEVLGPHHLDPGPGGERERRGGGAHRALGPVGAGGEPHRIGPGGHGGAPLDPEQPALGVAEGDHEPRVDGRLDQA